MKAKAKQKCFYKGVLYKTGQVATFGDDHKKDDNFNEFFEVIEQPKRSKKSDSTTDSQPGAAET